MELLIVMKAGRDYNVIHKCALGYVLVFCLMRNSVLNAMGTEIALVVNVNAIKVMEVTIVLIR